MEMQKYRSFDRKMKVLLRRKCWWKNWWKLEQWVKEGDWWGMV